MVRNLVPDLIRIVDDDPSVCASLTFILQIAGFDVSGVNLQTPDFQILVPDMLFYLDAR